MRVKRNVNTDLQNFRAWQYVKIVLPPIKAWPLEALPADKPSQCIPAGPYVSSSDIWASASTARNSPDDTKKSRWSLC